MTNDDPVLRRVHVRLRLPAAVAFLLLAAAIDGGCGGSAAPLGSSPEAGTGGPVDASHRAADASAANRSGSGSASLIPNGSGDAGDVSGACPEGGSSCPGSVLPDAETCVEDNQACSPDGLPCCNPGTHPCTDGFCGTCGVEGTPCHAGETCCDGLACTSFGDAGSFCGTDLCSPDGVACGGTSDRPCCNDDCTNGVCGSAGN